MGTGTLRAPERLSCAQRSLFRKLAAVQVVLRRISFRQGMGKEIFPVQLQECSIDYRPSRQQSIKRFFVYKEGEAASSRLRDVLDSRHLGLGMIFGWPPKDGERCPFPGLPATFCL